MKYSIAIDLDLPRERVIALFDDPANLVKWQKGLQSFEHVSGTPGEVGATSRLVFQHGKRRMEMIETITRRELPDAFDGTYDMPNVHNVMHNRFIELSPARTRWESDIEFQFSGFMKVIGFLFGSGFPKQSRKFMTAFKAFAEQGVDVRDG